MDDIMQVHYKRAQDMVSNLIFVEANSIDQKHPGNIKKNLKEIEMQLLEEI